MAAPAVLLSGRLRAAVYSVSGPIIVVSDNPVFSITSSFVSVTTSAAGTTTATFTIGRSGALTSAVSVGYRVTGLDGSWFQGGAAPDVPVVTFLPTVTRTEVSITFAAKGLPDAALTGTVQLYGPSNDGTLGSAPSFTFTIPQKVVTPGSRDFTLGTNSTWLFENFDARLGLYLERKFPNLTDYGSEVANKADLVTALANAPANTRIRLKAGISFDNISFSRNLASGWIMIDGQPSLGATKALNATCTGAVNVTGNGLVIRGIDFAPTSGTKTNPGASRINAECDRLVVQRCRVKNTSWVERLFQFNGTRSDVTVELNTFDTFSDHACYAHDIKNGRDHGLVLAYNIVENGAGGWAPDTPSKDPTVGFYIGNNHATNDPYYIAKAICYNWFESIGLQGGGGGGGARALVELKFPRACFFGNVMKQGDGGAPSANARGGFGHLWLCNDLETDISVRGRRDAILWNRLRDTDKCITLQYGNYDQENDNLLNDVGNGGFPGSASPRPAGYSARLFGNEVNGPIFLGGDVHNDIPGSGGFTTPRPTRNNIVKGHTLNGGGQLYKSVVDEGPASQKFPQIYQNGNVDSPFNNAGSHTLTPNDNTVPSGLRRPDIPLITKDMCGCFGDQSSLEETPSDGSLDLGPTVATNWAVHLGSPVGTLTQNPTGVQLQGAAIGNLNGGIRLYNKTKLTKPASGTPLKFQWKFKRLVIPTGTGTEGTFNFFGFVTNLDGTFPGNNSSTVTRDDDLLSTLKGWRITYGNINDSNGGANSNQFRLQVYKGDGTKYQVDPVEASILADLGLNTEHTMTCAIVGNKVVFKCEDLSLTQSWTDPGINGFGSGYPMFYTSYGAKSLFSDVQRIS